MQLIVDSRIWKENANGATLLVLKQWEQGRISLREIVFEETSVPYN
jgi:hypothetical protein